MTIQTASRLSTPRFRSSWLWSAKVDLLWTLMPFWLGFALSGALYLTRNGGTGPGEPGWNFSMWGREWSLTVLIMMFYGPLIDGPHLWATIARTYVDAEEWAVRRRLFITSLLFFAVGPFMVLLPYMIRAITPIPAASLDWGWYAFGLFLTNYALFHINKQHWGFVCLYKRKNADNDARENRVDAWFFNTAIWLPYFAMLTAPWDPATAASPIYRTLYAACHAVFLTICAYYVFFQVNQWRKGVVRNGPKLLYIATIIPLYYVTFALHPRLAAFWVLTTGAGHCAQYHAVVWQYGKKKYAGKPAVERRAPNFIFDNVWLYGLLAVLFAAVTLQGFGAGMVKNVAAAAMQGTLFSRAFTFLDHHQGIDLGIKIGAAFISGVRLHHFYVDSKIWKVSKSAALAKNLDVATPAQPAVAPAE